MLKLLELVGVAITELLPERNVAAIPYMDFVAENWPSRSVLVLPGGWGWNRTSRGGLVRELSVGVIFCDRIENETDLNRLDIDLNLVATSLFLDENDTLDGYTCKEVEGINAAELNPALLDNWFQAIRFTFQK